MHFSQLAFALIFTVSEESPTKLSVSAEQEEISNEYSSNEKGENIDFSLLIQLQIFHLGTEWIQGAGAMPQTAIFPIVNNSAKKLFT